MNDEYKYEVAFSFLQDDEQLALEIADRIRDRVNVRVFVYSERQDELVGTDGVDSFSRVFAEEARVVVVLHRKGWAQTKWTRVEENAIRSRGFNDGHDFVLLVKLDTTNPPIWLPPTRIYLGFDRYGIDGLASAIENRVQAAGGSVRNESVVDRARRIDHRINSESQRAEWRGSGEAIREGEQEAANLIQDLLKLAQEVTTEVDGIQINAVRNNVQSVTISTHGINLTIHWERVYANTLSSVRLYISLSRGGDHPFETPYDLERKRYDVDLDASRRIVWRELDEQQRFFTETWLVDFWMKKLLDQLERELR